MSGGFQYQVAGGALPYQVYSALISRDGGTDPIIISVLQNTITDAQDITWITEGVGQYRTGNTSHVFSLEKTSVFTQVGTNAAYVVRAVVTAGDVWINVLDSAFAEIDSWLFTYVEIRVYP